MPHMAGRKTNICLNMIVKNEVKVLPRLIRSVKDYIDYYVKTKQAEWAAYHEQVTPWEVKNYLTLF